MLRAPLRTIAALACTTLLSGSLSAQVPAPGDTQPGDVPVVQRNAFVVSDWTRVLDPKLAGGGASVTFAALGKPGTVLSVTVEVLRGATVEATLFNGPLTVGAPAVQATWDGRVAGGAFADVGRLALRLRDASGAAADVTLPMWLVRLGVTEIEAQPTTGLPAPNEWPMVYFRKNGTTTFYATPQTHEFLCVADAGDVSDLDLNDGSPRPAPAVHTATDTPVMEGTAYEDDSYNYPLCYEKGAQPQFEVTLGATCTDATGQQGGVGYPIAGLDLRVVASDGSGAWTSSHTAITPGGTATFTGPVLPSEVMRTDRTITWGYEYRAAGSTDAWRPVLGTHTTSHSFYTILGQPNFGASSGTQYAGPWVEVAEYVHSWRQQLPYTTGDELGLTNVLIQGFFGQQGTITTAIEGVLYDAYPLGGDGGANRYYLSTSKTIDLTALLNDTAKGQYVNCSDCASSTSTMLAMLGVDNVIMVYLGYMNLNAIWGIGAPGYTTNLWGTGSHAFSYHRIITRNMGMNVSDACLSVDEDGNPSSTPGIPGYNCERPWNGPTGYDRLSATNTVSRTAEWLPKLK
jgi:hypothetical protein